MDMINDLIPRIEAALTEDPRTRGTNFEVISQNGLITLKGRVNQPAVRDAALNITRQQEGVIDVIDEIELTHNEELEIPENLKLINNRPTTNE